MENVIVLFEVTIKDGKMEDYLARASKLKEHLKNIEGFIKARGSQAYKMKVNF